MRESLGTGHVPPRPHIEHFMCDRCTPIGILFLSSLLQGFQEAVYIVYIHTCIRSQFHIPCSMIYVSTMYVIIPTAITRDNFVGATVYTEELNHRAPSNEG